ncbi:CLUMA_CG002268, isoform A [Clunio marinus]|uniref:Dynein axonemal assembly factor 1 homolog n=1 Tax=Clunio marinus TaxID=568069 RepID=A0A1J1HK78_9DIPT|nr:CLUMA_CG002268, isoform A [Clunio marinus]
MSSSRETVRKMTKQAIMEQCKRNKLYTTPRLNDVLYLHFQGFPKIENLEEYTGLKCLWLESNAFTKIEGLDHQPNLKSLFLQNNLISKIENLDNCKELDTLVLSHNYVKTLENCCSNTLPLLNTLNISHNQLRNAESVEILKRCENISILDLSFNKIDDIMIVKVLGGMASLHVLNLTGNPVINSITNYRKTMILECNSLTYLDSRPVFPRDRACAEAWKSGGFHAEKREHEQWNREERRKIRRSVNALLCKSRGESFLLSSSEDEKDEDVDSRKIDVKAGGDASPKNEESSIDIYEGNQKELIEMYEMEQKEIDSMVKNVDDATYPMKVEKPINRATMIERIKNEEKVEQRKDELTKLLDISSDQDRILQMMQTNQTMEENIFGPKQNFDVPKKILIEEISDETDKSVQQNDIEEIPKRNDETLGNEHESMLWFEDEATETTRNFESIDYQFTNSADIVVETLVKEDLTNVPESTYNSEDFTKVLELCQYQKTDAMQLCFLNENEKLMQIYDEAVEKNLVQESDGFQLAEIENLCKEENESDDDDMESQPDLDGILTVKKFNFPSESKDAEVEEILQSSHDEINEVKEMAENLIDGIINSLEDIEMPF